MFNLLQPAPIAEEIQDPVLVKKKYKYWRLRTFYGMYIGYAFYYFSRKSFTFAIPSMLEEGFSLSELGMLGSILSITYGVSKFVSPSSVISQREFADSALHLESNDRFAGSENRR